MLNQCQIIGNLGDDPEVRNTQSGEQVATLRVATSEKWTDKNGEKKEATEWHRVVFFGKLAEVAGKYLTKGSKVFVQGKITTRKWQDKDGNDRYTTEIQGRELKMLDGKDSGGDRRQEPPQQNRQGNGGGQQQRRAAQDYDDSIPF